MKRKKFKAVALAHLDQETIDQIRIWRNQDFVRLQSLRQEIIDEATHQKWVEQLKGDENRHLFVCYLDDEPLGVIQLNYDPDTDMVESGEYLVSEDFQACGYGTILQFFEGAIIYEVLNYNRSCGVVLMTNTKNVRLQNRKSSVQEVNVHIKVGDADREIMRVSMTKEDFVRDKEKTLKLVSHFVDPDIEVIL